MASLGELEDPDRKVYVSVRYIFRKYIPIRSALTLAGITPLVASARGGGGGNATPCVFLKWPPKRSADCAYIANGASFEQLLVEKNWSSQARSRSYDVISQTISGRFSPKSRFQPCNVMQLTGMETLWVILVRTWSYLTFRRFSEVTDLGRSILRYL